jgi:hypothetical protein
MRIFKILLGVLLSFNAFSQSLFVGNHVIEPYIGFPNVTKYFPILALNQEPKNVTSYAGLPPSGFRYSYMLTDDISFGVDVIFDRSRKDIVSTDTVFQNGGWQYLYYEGKRIQTRLRLQFRMNFHLPIAQPNADSYIGLGFGTNNRWLKDYIKVVDSTDLSYPNFDWVLQRKIYGKDAILIPFSMRVCFGYRYYFNYNLGIVGEIGVGGPLLSIGLSYKL